MYNRDRAPTAERTKRWVSGAAGDYTSQNRSQASCKAVVAVRFDEELMCLRKVLSCPVLNRRPQHPFQLRAWT